MSIRASIRLLVWVCIIAVIFSVAAISMLTYTQQVNTVAARRLVIMTYKTLQLQQRYLLLIRDAETGQRGFLLTKNPSYLEPYTKGSALVMPALDEIISRTTDSYDLRKYAEVKRLTKVKLDELAESLQVFRKAGSAHALAVVNTNTGKKSMDAIYGIMDELQRSEEITLRDKTAELEKRAKGLEGLIGASSLVAVCSVLGTGWWMIAFLTAKVRAEEIATNRAAEARRSQIELSLVLASIGDGLYRLDPQGKITYLNKAAQTILGYSLEEVVGQSAHDLFHYSSINGIRQSAEDCPLIQVVRQGKEYSSVDTDSFIRKDGTFFPIRCISAPIYEENKLIGAVVSFTDVSEAKKAEKIVALQHSVSKILAERGTSDQTITDVIETVCTKIGWDLGAFWQLNLTGDALRLSAKYSDRAANLSSFEELSEKFKFKPGEGLPGRELQSGTGAWIRDINAHSEFPRAQAASAVGLRTVIAFPIVLAEKKLGVMEFFSRNDIERDENLLAALLSIGQQVGQVLQRKIQEDEIRTGQDILRTSEERFQLAVEGSQDGIWDWDLKNQTLYLSDLYLTLIGYERGYQFTPDEWSSLVHPDDVKMLRKASTEHLKYHVPFEIEYRLSRKDGSYVWFNSRGHAIWDENGKATRFSGSLRDVTEKKEAEKRISEFYSTVSHELRTPLTSIRGSLGLIEGGKAGEVPPKVLRLVAIGRNESERLIRLINDILDIKKIETGNFELNPESFDPERLVLKTIDGISGMAQENSVKLRSTVSTRMHLYGDFDRLVQVLTNLLSNAIKYSPKDGVVRITVEERENFRLRLSVTDQGPGIPEQKIHKLFGMFQQLDSSDSRKKGGTGLGLAISKSIVEQHSGNIGVESNPGEGSTFWFEIPIDRSYEVPDEKARVLVVESSSHWMEVLGLVFADSAFELVQARDIHEAENELAKSKPAFIVFDLVASGGSGLEFLQGIKENDRTADIPVIVLGGGEDKDSHGSAILLDWISKPFDPKQIEKSLLKALKNGKSNSKVLIVEDDESTREILRQQISGLGVHCIEAADGEQAISLARTDKPDLMVLDLGLPLMDGFDVVSVLRREPLCHLPLIVYTNRDLSREEKKQLSLGLTTHLVKAKTSEEELLKCVKGLLNGILV